MFYNLNRLFKILKISRIDKIFFLFFIILLNAFFEVISIGILIPFVSVMLEPELYTNFQNFVNNQNIIDLSYFVNLERKNFIINLIIFMIIIFMTKFLINLIYLWYTNSKKIFY